MLQEILKDLDKLTKMRFTPSIHIVEEVERLIDKIKSSMESKDEELIPEEQEEEVTINGVPVSFEKSRESKKQRKENRKQQQQ